MDFRLDENQKIIQQSVRSLVREEIRPQASAWDEEARFPAEIIPRLAELGLFGINVPEEYGGAGLDARTTAVIMEELAFGDGSIALTVGSHNALCTGHILLRGSEEQKRTYLPKLASGSWLGAWGLTEPGSGSDAAGMRTRAVREGSDWRISGSKTFITQGSVGKVAVILASTEPELKQQGITAFILEHSSPGFDVGKHIDKLGMRASDTCELSFNEVAVSDAQRLGEVNAGFHDTLKVLDGGRIGIGSLAVGLARAGLEDSLAYAQERQQFGRPIADFGAIQQKIADMATQVDAARLMVQRAAWLKDSGQPFRQAGSMAKLFASEIAMKVCEEAIQIHGGYGYTREFPVERYWRDAKLCTIGEGTSEIQRLIIARTIYQKL